MVDDDEFYGEADKKNIIQCGEDSPKGPAPPSIAEVGVQRIVGRTILEWDPYT